MEDLSLKDLIDLFWSKKIIILICVLIAVVAGAVYSFNFVKPKYQSSTKLVLSQATSAEEDGQNSTISTSDVTLNQKLISTYTEIIKSDTVLTEVINKLQIDDSISSLKSNISVSAVNDAQVLKITVNSDNPEKARDVANQIAESFDVKVKEVYDISNISVLDEATASSSPYNINHTKDIGIFAIAGFVISIIIILFLNMLDNTVGSAKEIESDLGTMVLASIPEYKGNAKQKGGKRYEK